MSGQIGANQPNGKSRRNFLKNLFLAGAYPAAKPLEIIAEDIAEELPEPINTGEAGLAQSTSTIDSPLESRIDAYVKARKRSGYLSNSDQFSITVYDIEHDRKIASINEDTRRMAASTIKNFVMLAVFDQVQRGNLRYTDTIKQMVESMISYNRGLRRGNRDTNSLIQLLGGTRIVNEIIRSRYGFFNNTTIVEEIPSNDRTYKNTTSSRDLNIFYNQMWHNRLPYSSEMKRILSLPKRDRLFDSTCIPDGVQQYTKSGYVYGMNVDSGILVMRDAQGNQHPYAISVMIEDKTKPSSTRRDGLWGRRRSELIRDISEGVYDYLYETYNGRRYVCRQHKGRHLGGAQ